MWRQRGRWAAGILPAIVIGGLSWCGWRWWDARRYRDAMARVELAMRTGRYAVAARDLSSLLTRRTDSDRAAYLLGVCEKARGRAPEADDRAYLAEWVAGRKGDRAKGCGELVWALVTSAEFRFNH